MIKDHIEVVNNQYANDAFATNVVSYNSGKSNYIPTTTSILDTPQEITESWVDCGTIVQMYESNGSYNHVNFLIDLDINDSQNVRFRCISNIPENPTVDYKFVIYNVKANVVEINEEYAELAVDADQQIVLEYQTYGLPSVQLQVQAGTVGATAGIVNSVYSVKLWK